MKAIEECRKEIFEKASRVLDEQQETFLRIQELFGAGSLLFRLKQTKRLHLEEYSRTALLSNIEKNSTVAERNKRRSKIIHFHSTYGMKTKDEASMSVNQDYLISNNPFYGLRHYRITPPWHVTSNGFTIERTLMMLGVSINKQHTEGPVAEQTKKFDDDVAWREPDFNINETHSSLDTIFDGGYRTDDEENSDGELFKNAPGVMWLSGKGTIFETVTISPSDLYVLSCPWTDFESLPFLDSPEFISFMNNDIKFRMMAECYKKNNDSLPMTKRFYEKLVSHNDLSVKEDYMRLISLVKGMNGLLSKVQSRDYY
jgi:hypothetical protein